MTVNMNAMDLITGLHFSGSPAFRGGRSNDKTMRHFVNGLNVAGWIPLAGVISGIARLIFTAYMYHFDKKQNGPVDPEAKAFYTTMILRGVIETLSLGFLLMAQDLIFTIGRRIASPSAKNGYEANQPPAHDKVPTSYRMFGAISGHS